MSLRMRLDPIACDGHGMCADLLPELIELDEWGYPILRSAQVPPGLAGHARRAARACPTLALVLTRPHQEEGARARAPRAGPARTGAAPAGHDEKWGARRQ